MNRNNETNTNAESSSKNVILGGESSSTTQNDPRKNNPRMSRYYFVNKNPIGRYRVNNMPAPHAKHSQGANTSATQSTAKQNATTIPGSVTKHTKKIPVFEKGSKDWELMDVDQNQFKVLISVVYNDGEEITDENVDFILKLARKYEFYYVMERCAQHLIKSTAFTRKEKLKYARVYNLDSLQRFLKQPLDTQQV